MLIKTVLLFLLGIYPSESKFYEANATDYTKCKIYHDHGDYPFQYTEFYELTNNSSARDSILDLHFSINSSSDVQILLASYSGNKINDPVYEIAITVSDSSLVDIRKLQKTGQRNFDKVIRDVLPAFQLRSFWVHISKNDVIKIGKEGNERPLVSWTDPDLDSIPVKIFSFATLFKNESTFYFDCHRGDDAGQQTVLVPSTKELVESALWLRPSLPDSLPKTTLMPTLLGTRPRSPSNAAQKSAVHYELAIITFLINLIFAFVIVN